MSSIIPIGKSRDDTPQLNELLTNIVEQYAVYWKRLGLNLGLKDYQLANISENNANRQSRQVETCCETVLQKWLQIDCSPTWGKLDDVVVSLTTTSRKESDHLKSYYKATRFINEEECWPPEQPKHFTPVVIIRQQKQWSKKQKEAMAKATMKGGIAEVLSTTASKTIKDLQEVFSWLEQLSDSQHQRSILIEGSPGVGKSILLKHTAYQWANDELLTNMHFLFLLQLRDPSVQQLDSLQSLVHHFYLDNDEQACSDLTTCVRKNGGKSVTILLDGYDELPPNLRRHGFIIDLLQHKVLPNCLIVVSSRPHASTHLRDNVTYQVEILGFSEQDQQHFIEHSLEDQPHKISEVKQYLKHHSTISNLCFIPFNMTILLFLYKNKEETPLPTNSTDLYNLFICLTICRHLAKSGNTLDEEITHLNSLPQPLRKIINQLSKFAFEILGENQLVFTLPEIKKECPDIDKAINGFGLLQAVRGVEITSKPLIFNFIHFSIQEFLAAHHVTTLPQSEELSFLQKNFWNNPVYFNMFDMYVALTGGQQPSFKQFLQPSSMEKFRNFFGREDSVGVSQQLLNDKIKCLRIYYCFQEAGDEVMCKSIEEAAKLDKQQIDIKYTKLSPSDLECLKTFLTCSSYKEWKMLELSECHIQDHGLQLLQSGLRSSNVSITALELMDNDLTAVSSSAISDLTINCGVKVLNISGNNTVGEDDRLYKILTDHSSMVEQLRMHSIMLSSNAAIKLFTSLSEAKKLMTLEIQHNGITDEACDAINMAMKKNTSLVELHMYHNPIGGEGAQLIVQALQHNNTLQLLWLNDDYPDDVKDKITSLEEEINEKRKTHGCHVKLSIQLRRHPSMPSSKLYLVFPILLRLLLCYTIIYIYIFH